MDREYVHDRIPEQLVRYLEAAETRRFRRRIVLTKGNDRWELACCTVEGFLPGESIPEARRPWRYPQAILSEDLLDATECLDFAKAVHAGRAVVMGGVELVRNQNTQWRVEVVSVNNDYMTRAGHVVSVQFTQSSRASVKTLVAPEPPYFPDIDSAARAWLPFPIYHGHTDSRNEQIVFLLPESRAFIADATPAEDGNINVVVAGSAIGALKLLIKGAYWQGKTIDHIHEAVIAGKARFAVPTDADRLEYCLIDDSGVIYDFYREDQYSRLAPDKRKLGAVTRTLADQVREACSRDEGLHIEFKPFVAPEQNVGTPGQKTKLREVVATVVAFANTEGGHLYLGIDDDCTISGINSDLQKWLRENSGVGELDDGTVAKYLSALKQRIKELVNGDTSARLAHVRIGDAIVIIVEVPRAARRPLTIEGDYHLYVRIGNKTRKLSPDQWRAFLASND